MEKNNGGANAVAKEVKTAAAYEEQIKKLTNSVETLYNENLRLKEALNKVIRMDYLIEVYKLPDIPTILKENIINDINNELFPKTKTDENS